MDARGAVIDVHALDDVIGYFYLFTSTLHRQKIQNTDTHIHVRTHTYTHGRFTFAHGLFMNSEHCCNDCNAPALTLFELLI